MTRLANLEKAGYFPTPPLVTAVILSYITAPHGGRILNPCAGEGAALVTLARTLNLEPFGVELHESRAQVARQAVEELLTQREEEHAESIVRVLQDSYQSLITSRDGYNVLYLNPPYDYDDEGAPTAENWEPCCTPKCSGSPCAASTIV